MSPVASLSPLDRNRTGTSINAFLAKFPDSDACLEHIFATRFGAHYPCPGCGSAQGWYRIGKSTAYAPRCCFRQRVYPLSGTLFAHSNVPLHKWFYAILHFCNAGAGLSANFLAIQLGISGKAATRMADRIRRHMHAIDADLRIGGDGVRVLVDETKLRNVIDPVKGARNAMRILMLSDGTNFHFLPIPKGNFRAARQGLARKLHPHSTLCFRDRAIFQKLSSYRKSLALPETQFEIHADPFSEEFTSFSVICIRMKLFIITSHIWISSGRINQYLACFEFIYRRVMSGRSPFMEAIGCFPDIDAPGVSR